MTGFTLLDALAFVWFLTAWVGYTWFADRPRKEPRTLIRAVDDYRLAWMQRMLRRENRIADAAIIGNIMRSIGFFASTTIFILAGLIAMMGATDKIVTVVADVPFAAPTTPFLLHLKLLLLITIFIYAFFKFTWSLRQYNYTSILIGAAPDSEEVGFDRVEYARRAAGIAGRGTEHFNGGLRAYYFGLAILSWFLHAGALILASAWVVLVMYRREFRSGTLKELQDGKKYLLPNGPKE